MDYSIAENAKNNFLNGLNCAQSVLVAFCDVIKMDREQALRISSSFGGGMGRLREVCGAVSGSFMVAGLIFSKAEQTTSEKGAHYALIQDFAKRFIQKNGSIICRELLAGVEVTSGNTPEERNTVYYKKRPCAEYVYDASCIIIDMINEKGLTF